MPERGHLQLPTDTPGSAVPAAFESTPEIPCFQTEFTCQPLRASLLGIATLSTSKEGQYRSCLRSDFWNTFTPWVWQARSWSEFAHIFSYLSYGELSGFLRCDVNSAVISTNYTKQPTFGASLTLPGPLLIIPKF